MRRMLLLLMALTAMTLSCPAQDRSNRIGAALGLSFRPSAEMTLFWEHETSYHNAWEVFAEGALQLSQLSQAWDRNARWAVGAAWKPCLYRGRNRYGSVRIGASLGAAPESFQATLLVGWQQSYALRGGWQLYWQAGACVTVPRWDGLLHAGGSIGIKLPVLDRRIR